MRPFELTLLLLTAAGALLLDRTPAARWPFLALAAALLGTQLALEGPHWQLAPAYLALAIILWRAFAQNPHPSRLAHTATLSLCLVTAVASYALPMFRLPAPTGPDAIGTRTLHLTDPTRNRELVIQLWYPTIPAGPRARYVRPAEVKPLMRYEAQIRTNAFQDAPILPGAAYPIVLLGHQWGGRRTGYTFLAEDLASHGYLVVAMDHPGNSARTELADGRIQVGAGPGLLGNVQAHSAAEVEADWNHQLTLWTEDDTYILNQLQTLNRTPDTWASGHLDLTQIAAVGHSFGGASSMALLGVDPRVKCAVNLDGWTFAGLAHRTTQPVLFVYEGVSRIRTSKPGTEGTLDDDDNRTIDQSLARYGGLRAFVDGTQHLDFSDQTLLSPIRRLTYTGPIAPERAREITRALVLSFLDANLKQTGNPQAQFPEVHWDATPTQPVH